MILTRFNGSEQRNQFLKHLTRQPHKFMEILDFLNYLIWKFWNRHHRFLNYGTWMDDEWLPIPGLFLGKKRNQFWVRRHLIPTIVGRERSNITLCEKGLCKISTSFLVLLLSSKLFPRGNRALKLKPGTNSIFTSLRWKTCLKVYPNPRAY